MAQWVKDMTLSLQQPRSLLSWVQSLAHELPHATGVAKKEKKKNKAILKYLLNNFSTNRRVKKFFSSKKTYLWMEFPSWISG